MNTNQANAGATMENIKHETRQTVDELKEQTRQAGTQLKQKALEATEQIKEQGREMVSQQKESMTGSLGHFGSALRNASHQLRDNQETGIATVTEKLADQVDMMTDYLRGKDFNGIYYDIQGYARRHPELVFGAMFFAGLAIGRFLKATPDGGQEARNYSAANMDQHPELLPATVETPPSSAVDRDIQSPHAQEMASVPKL